MTNNNIERQGDPIRRGGLTMRAAIFEGPGRIEVGERPDPAIAAPSDAIVRVTLGCVCGSDLWYYRGESPHDLGPIGHEFIGVVTEVGSAVTGLAAGDLVVAPFTYSDGTCPHCLAEPGPPGARPRVWRDRHRLRARRRGD
jgi:threonine dehydrogenase-like Zn-dependent dehydrogenase